MGCPHPSLWVCSTWVYPGGVGEAPVLPEGHTLQSHGFVLLNYHVFTMLSFHKGSAGGMVRRLGVLGPVVFRFLWLRSTHAWLSWVPAGQGCPLAVSCSLSPRRKGWPLGLHF